MRLNERRGWVVTVVWQNGVSFEHECETLDAAVSYCERCVRFGFVDGDVTLSVCEVRA